MRNEIIFSYNDTRCHATVVDQISVDERNYIGKINGYEIYKTYGIIFDQFGFEAIKVR